MADYTVYQLIKLLAQINVKKNNTTASSPKSFHSFLISIFCVCYQVTYFVPMQLFLIFSDASMNTDGGRAR